LIKKLRRKKTPPGWERGKGVVLQELERKNWRGGKPGKIGGVGGRKSLSAGLRNCPYL